MKRLYGQRVLQRQQTARVGLLFGIICIVSGAAILYIPGLLSETAIIAGGTILAIGLTTALWSLNGWLKYSHRNGRGAT